MSTKVLPSPEAEWRYFSRWWDELLRRAKRALGTDFGTNLPVASSPSLTAITGLAPTTPLSRPNQIFAVGGLPLSVLEGERARRVVGTVEANL